MEASKLYHIYNRGNNREKIFFNRENYLFFLRKVRNHLIKQVDILAYCLMPNHFHFLINTKENFDSAVFGNELKVMLRSYTRAINKQENRTGSLFQQHTKIKCLDEEKLYNYAYVCFHYIHQNPLKAQLVDKMEDYEMSSFQDFAGIRAGTLINKVMANQLLQIPIDPLSFVDQSYKVKIDDVESFLRN